MPAPQSGRLNMKRIGIPVKLRTMKLTLKCPSARILKRKIKAISMHCVILGLAKMKENIEPDIRILGPTKQMEHFISIGLIGIPAMKMRKQGLNFTLTMY